VKSSSYIGRLAPSPTGLLHLGHAGPSGKPKNAPGPPAGVLLLRNDDLDPARCRPEFVTAMVEDMRWFGLQWEEPRWSRKAPGFRSIGAALARLLATGYIYPCAGRAATCSPPAGAPHDGDEADEPVYPPQFRPPATAPLPPLTDPVAINWRFSRARR